MLIKVREVTKQNQTEDLTRDFMWTLFAKTNPVRQSINRYFYLDFILSGDILLIYSLGNYLSLVIGSVA